MKRIDFYQKRKSLHNEMIEGIVALFEKAGIKEIDLCPDDEWQYNAYVLYCPDGADSIREFRVAKVRCNGGLIEVIAEGDESDNWISCEHAGDIMTCSLDGLYDAVYDYVSDINRTYYECELDRNGKPTGEVIEKTYRIEYAENHMRERGNRYGRSYLYKSRATAKSVAIREKVLNK